MEPQEIRKKAFAFVEAKDEAGFNAFMGSLSEEEIKGFNEEMMRISQLILSAFMPSGEDQ